MCLCPIKVVHGDLICMVRCGQCKACRIRAKQCWVGRLRLEALDHGANSRFLTLTYRKEERPEELPLGHLRDFMKRYRYYYGSCRFFAVGEYGEEFGGAHWHVIIFGHAPIEAARLSKKGAHWHDNKAWEFGFTQDGSVTAQSIGYVAGYTLKGLAVGERQPICRQSLKPGIGFRRIAALGEASASIPLERWPTHVSVGGRKYPMSDGALARFQLSYLESGGVPPVSQTPDALDLSARCIIGDLGTRIEASRRRNLMWERERDEQAAKAFKPRSDKPGK